MCVALSDRKINFADMMKNWVLVYFANFIGALIFAYLVFCTGLFATNNDLLGATVIKNCRRQSKFTFLGCFHPRYFLQHISCFLGSGWLLPLKTLSVKFSPCWFPVMLFVLSGFEHCVANMYYIPRRLTCENCSAVCRSFRAFSRCPFQV